MIPKKRTRTIDEDGRMNQPPEKRDYTDKDNYDKEYDNEYNGKQQNEDDEQIENAENDEQHNNKDVNGNPEQSN